MEQDDKQFLRALRARLAAKVALLDQLLLADTGTLQLSQAQAVPDTPAPES